MMTGNHHAIEIRELHHVYAGPGGGDSIAALRGIDLTLPAGQFVALVGANGSGKTTLARHINGLLLPTHGQVQVNGWDTRDRTAWPHIRAQVALVFQRPEDQIVATTVADDVAFGPENFGLPSEEIERRVRQALETVHMWSCRHRPPHLLSVGQQQRVAIAGALALHPTYLLLDEATAMLDPAGRQEVEALLQRLHAQGMTIVSITHRMEAVVPADRVIALAAGRVAFNGTPRCFFADADRLAELRLAPPPAVALAIHLRRYFPDLPTDILTVEEIATALARVWPGEQTDFSSPSSSFPCKTIAGDCPPAVTVEGIQYTYMSNTPLATTALMDAQMEIHTGEVVALLGPTGAGKTTLLQQIAGLASPQMGRITLFGRDLEELRADHHTLRQWVGMLFQRPEEQLFETYVGDDVAFGPRQLGLDRDAVRERVRWAMEMVGLPFADYKDRFTQSLSGGEQRKAALAGVLALRPRLLLLDEPTAGLDPQTRRDILVVLERLNQDAGQTIMIATHNMEDAAELAHRVYVIAEGEVIMGGPTRRVFCQQDSLVSLGLESPAATVIAQALRKRGLPVPMDVLTLDELEAVLQVSMKRRGDAL